MGKPSREEITQALGAEQLKGAKQAGVESVKEAANDPKTQELQALIAQALSIPSQPVIIQVSRRPQLRGRYSYIGTIDYIDAQSFAQLGIQYIVKDFGGGGNYECTVQVQGMEDSVVHFDVEGEPLPPKPERGLPQNQQPFYGPQNPPPQGFGQQQGFGQLPAQTMAPGSAMPWNPGMSQVMNPGMLNPMNPIHAQMMAMGFNPMQPQQPQQNGMDKVLDTMRQLMTEQRELFVTAGEDPEKKALELQVQSEKEARLRSEAEAKRVEDRQAFEKQMEQMRHDQEKLIEKMAKPPENTSVKILEVMAPLIGPLLPLLMTRGEESAKSMNNLFGTMMEQQRNSSQSQMDTMKLMMERPGVEDRMAKIANAVGGSMANQVGLVGTLLNGVLQQQAGDNPPAWLSIVSQLIDTGGAVAQSMVSGAFEEEEEVIPQGQHQMQRPPGWDPALQGQQARARILSQAAVQPAEEPEEAEIGAEGSEPQIEEFDTAMQTIFTMISQDEDSNEIAFRLWKHAASGVRIAYDWFMHPEEGTHTLLKALRGNQQITVSDQRIGEVAASIRALYDHLEAKLTPEAWMKKHNIRTRMPRSVRTHISPQPTANMDGRNADEFGQGRETSAPVGKIKVVAGGRSEPAGEAVETPMGTKGIPEDQRAPSAPVSDGARLADMSDRARKAQQAPGGPLAGATRTFSKPPQVVELSKNEGEEGKKEEEASPTPETPDESDPQTP